MTTDTAPVLGILGAIEAEVTLLRDALTSRRDERVLGLDVHHGLLDGHPVVLARCGVGKVNGGLGAAVLSLAGAQALVFTGVAGGVAPGMGIGDLVVATDLVQHDVDVTALGRVPGELLGEPAAWPCDVALADRLHAAALAVAGEASVHRGRIASGDQFVASSERSVQIHATFGALATEMEGAATAQACAHLGLPCVVVRSLSDTADETADVDFPAFLAMASRRSLALLRAFLAG